MCRPDPALLPRPLPIFRRAGTPAHEIRRGEHTHHGIDGIGGSRKQPTKGRHIQQRLQAFDGAALAWGAMGKSGGCRASKAGLPGCNQLVTMEAGRSSGLPVRQALRRTTSPSSSPRASGLPPVLRTSRDASANRQPPVPRSIGEGGGVVRIAQTTAPTETTQSPREMVAKIAISVV